MAVSPASVLPPPPLGEGWGGGQQRLRSPALRPAPRSPHPHLPPEGEGATAPRWLATPTAPLPPRGGGAGKEGAHAEQERSQARQQIRTALAAQLATQLGCPAHSLHISHSPGQPPRLLRAGQTLPWGLSISHAPGLSLAAWSPQNTVGIDLQTVPHDAAPEELLHTATLFLGSKTAATLARQAQSTHFVEAFTHLWAAHEAALKCLGLGLVEYQPALAAQLARVQVAPLPLPAWAGAGRVAALAWCPRR